ncbi:minor capsid protein [Mammaliicoccus sciuri]
MDFIDMLQDKINSLPGLPVECKQGYLGTEESFVLYPLPGGRVVQEYMDGATDEQLNYEIAMQSKLHSKINNTLWSVQTELEKLKELESKDNSFTFDEIIVVNKPFPINYTTQGFFAYAINVQANITVFKEEKTYG